MKSDTWLIDCIDYECDGHMDLQEITNTSFSVKDDGPAEHTFEAWVCNKCDEWITEVDRESKRIESYQGGL